LLILTPWLFLVLTICLTSSQFTGLTLFSGKKKKKRKQRCHSFFGRKEEEEEAEVSLFFGRKEEEEEAEVKQEGGSVPLSPIAHLMWEPRLAQTVGWCVHHFLAGFWL
jgi:hypothetical protein